MSIRLDHVVRAVGLLAMATGGFMLWGAYQFAASAFDDYQTYMRQGYHQCDSPSGWCDNEREEKPCGK